MAVIKKLLLFVLLFLIGIAALEISLRIAFYIKNDKTLFQSYMYVSDEITGYKLNDSYKGDFGKFYNGFRTFPYEINESAGKKRICIMGASVTFGHAQKNINETYPVILESHLNKNDDKYEVLNLAVPGFGTSQFLRLLEKEIPRLKPDILILNLPVILIGCLESINDWCPNNVYCDNHPIERVISATMYNNSILYVQVRKILLKLFVSPDIQIQKKEVAEALLNAQYNNYLRIFELCQKLDSKVFVIEYPTKDFDDLEYNENLKILKKATHKYRIDMIDCVSYFKKMTSEERGDYFIDSYHLKIAGNKIISNILKDEIENYFE